MATIEQRLQALENDVFGSTTANTDPIYSNVSSNSSNISSLFTITNDHESRISSLEGGGGLGAQVAALETRVSNNETAISGHESRITTLETDMITVQGQIAQFQIIADEVVDARTSSVYGAFTVLNDRLEAGDQEVATARSSDSYGSFGSLDQRIEAVDAEVVGSRVDEKLEEYKNNDADPFEFERDENIPIPEDGVFGSLDERLDFISTHLWELHTAIHDEIQAGRSGAIPEYENKTNNIVAMLNRRISGVRTAGNSNLYEMKRQQRAIIQAAARGDNLTRVASRGTIERLTSLRHVGEQPGALFSRDARNINRRGGYDYAPNIRNTSSTTISSNRTNSLLSGRNLFLG